MAERNLTYESGKLLAISAVVREIIRIIPSDYRALLARELKPLLPVVRENLTVSGTGRAEGADGFIEGYEEFIQLALDIIDAGRTGKSDS